MDENRVGTLFGRSFPSVCRVVLMGAILVWGVTIIKAVWDQAKIKNGGKQSGGINWQDITPTCDGVLCDLGKVHANIQEDIGQCLEGRLSPDDFNVHLLSAKRRLRKVNAAGVDDPEAKSALLQLRQHQIVLYTGMRKEVGQFCKGAGAGDGATTKDASGVMPKVVKEWQRAARAFSGQLGGFAVQASILPDEIPDQRAAAVIFAEAASSGKALDRASVPAGSRSQGPSDGQGGK